MQTMNEVLYTKPNGNVTKRTVYHHMDIENLRYEVYSPIPKWKQWVLTHVVRYKVS